jgi:hypothetical protein
MDSLTSEDIDRIYNRLEHDVDLDNIRNEQDLERAVRRNNRTRSWPRDLNTFFWKEISQRRPIHPTAPTLPVQARQAPAVSPRARVTVKASGHQASYMRSPGRAWTALEIDSLKEGRQHGLTFKAIAGQLGRSTSSVKTKHMRIR